MAEIMHARV